MVMANGIIKQMDFWNKPPSLLLTERVSTVRRQFTQDFQQIANVNPARRVPVRFAHNYSLNLNPLR